MKNGQKTAGETANPITFMAEWIDFTQHLTNAQFGRLARCVARFERGDINPQHVAEGLLFIRLMTRTGNRRRYRRRVRR